MTSAKIAALEEWRDVPGTDVYQVSSIGRVRHRINGVRKLRISTHGYPCLTLKGKKPGSFSVHRLVAEAFIGPSNGLTVDHINGRRDDNRVENLEYVTFAENHRRARVDNRRNAKGVSKRTGGGKNQWFSRIMVDGHMKNLGSFPTEETAMAAYTQARATYLSAAEPFDWEG